MRLVAAMVLLCAVGIVSYAVVAIAAPGAAAEVAGHVAAIVPNALGVLAAVFYARKGAKRAEDIHVAVTVALPDLIRGASQRAPLAVRQVPPQGFS